LEVKVMRLLLLAFSLLPVSGCGGNNPAVSVQGSCDYRDVGGNSCYDYTEATVDVLMGYQAKCSTGIWGDSLCSHTNSVGGCRNLDPSTKAHITLWYYTPDVLLPETCGAEGTSIAVAP
jgi:hypothetical protein